MNISHLLTSEASFAIQNSATVAKESVVVKLALQHFAVTFVTIEANPWLFLTFLICSDLMWFSDRRR
jgi:hypothetical protein